MWAVCTASGPGGQEQGLGNSVTVGLPGPLENTKREKPSHSPSLFLVTKEELDNSGPALAGSGTLDPGIEAGRGPAGWPCEAWTISGGGPGPLVRGLGGFGFRTSPSESGQAWRPASFDTEPSFLN